MGSLDLRGKTYYSDSAGEIQIIPIGDPRCLRDDLWILVTEHV